MNTSNEEETRVSPYYNASSYTNNIHDNKGTTIIPSIQKWFRDSAWPGMGLFGESYLLFSIGTLKPVWEILFPECLTTHSSCSKTLTSSLSYSVVLGVITGMIAIGYLANDMGRRKGSLLTATLMALGALGMLLSSFLFSNDAHSLFISMVVLLAIFGIGVGGEYPLSASSASEKCIQHGNSTMDSRTDNKKGRRVLLVFTMQGMGIFVNSLTQSILLVFTKQFGHYIIIGKYYNDDAPSFIFNYDTIALLWIWRIIYAIGAGFLVYVLISRFIHLEESEAWASDKEQQRKQQQSGTLLPSSSARSLLFRFYGMRLFGASMTWLLWDIAFYGNKLFQSTFIKALTGENSSLLQLSAAATLNAFVALLGYFAASYIVDFPFVGRVRLQSCGFALTGILFTSCGFFSKSIGTTWLVALYLGSSFFGQCGPNATTFLIPSEIFPTEIRTMCHGISASSGKVGALISAILFNYLDEVSLFMVSGICSFVACALTVLTIPETVNLDLTELDRHWRILREGRSEQDYVGPATHSDFLSVYEARFVSTENVNSGIQLNPIL